MQWIDIISFNDNDIDGEDSEDIISNEVSNAVMSLLYSYEPFIIMLSNYDATGRIDVKDYRSSVAYVLKHGKGIADIKQICYTVISCISNLDDAWQQLADITKQLIDKYDKL